MSSRTLRILANVKKMKYLDDLENDEADQNEDSPSMSTSKWMENIPPEYSFLYHETFDDEDKDPDFHASSDELNDSDSDEENTETTINNLQTGIKKKRKVTKENVDDQGMLDNVQLPVSEKTLRGQYEAQIIDNQVIGEGGQLTDETKNEGINSESHRPLLDNQMEIGGKNQAEGMLDNTQIIVDEENINPQNDIEMENHDPAVNHQQTDETLDQQRSSKRHRTLEKQMENNRKKHPVKDPCQCKLRCYEKFSLEQRIEINKEYWNMNRHLQRVWLSTKVNESLTRRKLREGGRRNMTRKYVLPMKKADDNTIADVDVCQIFFLRTLGYGNANILTTLSKSLRDPNGNKRLVPLEDQRGHHSPANKKDRNVIIAHINEYNPTISHYTREHAPNRKYLPPDLTIKFMHNDYCNSHPDSKVSYEVYRSTIDHLNIGFYEPTPEKCGFCQEMDLNPTEENVRLKTEHLEKVSQIRQMYKKDSAVPISDAVVFAADMQKVVLLPRMPDIKESFFTSRLITFNETFASMQKKGHHHVVLWHEGIAGRRAEDVASAFIKFLSLNRDSENIIVWMDNCTGQNKNFALYSAVICYINSDYCSTKEIVLKYLIKGHTFMAADGLHGRIEQAMRKMKNVYDFDDFKVACQKSSHRTELTCLQPEDFFKFENIIRTRRSKGHEDTLPYFKDITAAKFTRGSTNFMYQVSPTGEFRCTENTLKKKVNLRMPQHMDSHRGIAVNKKATIVSELVPKMPESRKLFWVNLPDNSNSEDLLQAEGL